MSVNDKKMIGKGCKPIAFRVSVPVSRSFKFIDSRVSNIQIQTVMQDDGAVVVSGTYVVDVRHVTGLGLFKNIKKFQLQQSFLEKVNVIYMNELQERSYFRLVSPDISIGFEVTPHCSILHNTNYNFSSEQNLPRAKTASQIQIEIVGQITAIIHIPTSEYDLIETIIVNKDAISVEPTQEKNQESDIEGSDEEKISVDALGIEINAPPSTMGEIPLEKVVDDSTAQYLVDEYVEQNNEADTNKSLENDEKLSFTSEQKINDKSSGPNDSHDNVHNVVSATPIIGNPIINKNYNPYVAPEMAMQEIFSPPGDSTICEFTYKLISGDVYKKRNGLGRGKIVPRLAGSLPQTVLRQALAPANLGGMVFPRPTARQDSAIPNVSEDHYGHSGGVPSPFSMQYYGQQDNQEEDCLAATEQSDEDVPKIKTEPFG